MIWGGGGLVGWGLVLGGGGGYLCFLFKRDRDLG